MAKLKAETTGPTGTSRGWGEGGGGHKAKQLPRLSEAQKPSLEEDRAATAACFIRGGPADGSLNPQVTKTGLLGGTANSQGGDRLWDQDTSAGQATISLGCHTQDSVSRIKSTVGASKPFCPLASVSSDGDINVRPVLGCSWAAPHTQ